MMLKKVEQESRMIEKFMQKFKRVAKESRYKKKPLIEEFKRGMNNVIRHQAQADEDRMSSNKY